jgi:hypothetical protein
MSESDTEDDGVDAVRAVVHVDRTGRGFRRVLANVGLFTTHGLRLAIGIIAGLSLIGRLEPSEGAAAALSIGVLWAIVAPIFSKPRASTTTVVLTDESLLVADGATVLDWSDVRSHAVVGDRLFFEPTEEARKADPIVRRRYSFPLGPNTRETIVDAFRNRPRA